MLTICLVTQGRAEVHQFLESASAFRELDFVNFLVIDNGAPFEESSIIEAWSKIQPRTTYVRREENTIDFNDIWPLLELHASDWINFPGDDDRLILEGYSEWKKLAAFNTDTNVIAMSARVISGDGNSTGETVSPVFSTGNSVFQQLALALNSPPFFWPALFFRKTSLVSPFPRSRFVLDWLISLQLIIKGGILVSDVYSLEYRRHENQESNQVSLNRKFFEATFRIEEFLSGNSFGHWLNSLNDDEKLILWNTAVLSPPIYGDSDFGNILLFRLSKILISSTSNSAVQNQIVSDLSLKLGTLHHDKSLGEILHFDSPVEAIRGNIRIANPENTCPTLQPLAGFFLGNPNAISVFVCCKHRNPQSGAIRIKCDDYLSLSEAQKLDKLVQDINTALELAGKLGFRISPRERRLLNIVRKVKPLASKHLLMKIRKWL